MFSKALFKQSCKANGTMWLIITLTVCFMLACVMLISGNGNIGEVKNSIQDTIIMKEIDAQLEQRALSYYNNIDDGLSEFDYTFTKNAEDTLSYLIWFSKKPNSENFENTSEYSQALKLWQNSMPTMTTESGKKYEKEVQEWFKLMPDEKNYTSSSQYIIDLKTWNENSPLTETKAITIAFSDTCSSIQDIFTKKGHDSNYTDIEIQEMIGSIMYTINPNGMFNDFYLDNNENEPIQYDYITLISHIVNKDINDYLNSSTHQEYRKNIANESASIFLAGNMIKTENIENMMNVLASYGVTYEKYNTFGYSYNSIKKMAKNTILTYQSRIDYELDLLKDKYNNSEFSSEDEYLEAISNKKISLANEISSSFLSTLPEAVSDALEEIGQADLYTLIVGSIFYKLAGLLLPIIFMIMASNNLIAGQVDSGSMAYVLSTSTKRKSIVFTQALYLIGSLFSMFSLTTITSCICLSLISEPVELTYCKLILLNLGAFLVLFALSGLCYLTSCFFDRSKKSMAIGGGLSIFALVAAMLGLFGSPVIPSVVRLDTLNYFNYTTIISLFDVISIIDETSIFIWKFIILILLGLTGYILGSIKFIKKDLPL